MKFNNEMHLRDYIASLGGRLYLVGGAVRDIVMGKDPADKDYAVEGLSELPFNLVGRDFPVYLVEVDNVTCEVALCRTERKTGLGYNGFEVKAEENVTIKDDLKRRDFTMNAMALDLHNYILIDPFNGMNHIKRKLLVHTSEAFKEDPLRIVRAARFAARFNLKIANETLMVMRGDMSEELKEIPGERVGQELYKMFQQVSPKDRREFFDVLSTTQTLHHVFPEIDNLFVLDKHDGTTYNHVMNLLEHATSWLEFMMFLAHDLGKGETDPSEHPSHHGHDKLGVPVAKKMGKRLSLGKNITRMMVAASKEHMRLKQFSEMKPSKQIRMVEKYGYTDALALMNMTYRDSIYREGADRGEQNNIYHKNYVALFLTRDAIENVTGKDLIKEGIKPGPHFGQQLEQRRISYIKKWRKK